MTPNHEHCPCGCEHPQPFSGVPDKGTAEFFYLDPSREQAFCGYCWVVEGSLCAMVPCTPKLCGDEK
jgi:hypothetical protein